MEGNPIISKDTGKTRHLKYEVDVIRYSSIEENRIKEHWYAKNFGLTHREDGPAIIHHSGKVMWAFLGNLYPFLKWADKVGLADEEEVYLKLIWDKQANKP